MILDEINGSMSLAETRRLDSWIHILRTSNGISTHHRSGSCPSSELEELDKLDKLHELHELDERPIVIP